MRIRYKTLAFCMTSIAFALSLIMLLSHQRSVDNSATPLSFGTALIALVGLWISVSFKLLKRKKYTYDWYPPEMV
jgi:hypothetical protein